MTRDGRKIQIDNPYQSPAGDNRAARSAGFGRMMLIAAGLLLVVLGPIVWQANRERRARQRAVENLRQIGDVLRQYQAQGQAEHAAPVEASGNQ
ncbi:MAG TPA: hypothetical protein VJ783_26255 [Pirellulales bacterium]|nr:hypothetical protein [Pirellulales bacterium]